MDIKGNDRYHSYDADLINTSEDLFNMNSDSIEFLYTVPTTVLTIDDTPNIQPITLAQENLPQFTTSSPTSPLNSQHRSRTSPVDASKAEQCLVSPNSTNKFNSVIELLTEWGIDEIKHRFIACGGTLEIMQDLQPNHIQRIFNKDEYLGMQAQFERHLKELKNQNKNKHQNTTGKTSVEHVNNSNSAMVWSITETNFQTNLDSILNCYDGKAIRSYYKHHNSLNDACKDLLVNLIVNTLISTQVKLSTKIANEIADHICFAFPNEIKEYYYIQQKNSAPKGRLYNLYQRRTYNLRKSGLQEPLQKVTPPKNSNHYISELNAEETCLWLQHHREPWDDIRNAWAKCIQHRMKDLLNESDPHLGKIFKRWPLYKHSHGYDLIEIDFKFIYPNALNVFVEFEDFADKVFQIMKTKIKDKLSLSIIKEMIHSDLTQDGRNAGIAWLLNALIVPVSKLITKDVNNKTQHKKFTIRDGQNSFILLIQSISDLDNALKFRSSINSPLQPIIMVIGEEILKPMEFYVYVDRTKYKCFSFLSAMDIAFKIYHVLNLKYPIESISVWQFIQSALYNISTPHDKVYSLHKILLQELKK